jgi:hypothetical protein
MDSYMTQQHNNFEHGSTDDANRTAPPLQIGEAFGICTRCWNLRGNRCSRPGEGRVPDPCACLPRTVHGEGGLCCTLCYVCGIGIASGHTKWRLYVCTDCRDTVRAFNAVTSGIRLLLGAHSLVNGSSIPLDRDSEDGQQLVAEIKNFIQELRSVDKAYTALCTRRNALVQQRCEELGLVSGDVVLHGTYAHRVRDSGLTIADARHNFFHRILQ